MSRTAIRQAHEAWSQELVPHGLQPGDEMPPDAPKRHTVTVTCAECSHEQEISVPDDPEVEVPWQCSCGSRAGDFNPGCECRAKNLIEGHAGEPGAASLNPAATALTKEEVLEAAVREGLIDETTLTPEHWEAIERVRNTPRPNGVVHRLSVGGEVGAGGGSANEKVPGSSESSPTTTDGEAQ